MKIDNWIVDGARVVYEAVSPPRDDNDLYFGEIDGDPIEVSRDPKIKRYVVRLKHMDDRYRAKYGRNVVAICDLKFIRRNER
jgi:hypothetical protein